MDKIKFVPFSDKIVISPLKSDSFVDEGKLQEVGEVIAIGNGKEVYDAKIKVGDTVYFNAEGIRKVKVDDVEYYVISCCPEFILGKKDETKKKPAMAK